MMKSSTLKRSAVPTALAFALICVAGCLSETYGQRDPFKKAGWATKKESSGSGTSTRPAGPGGGSAAAETPAAPVSYAPPTIEARIDYYKRQREAAAASGSALPKVTSVLTLSELAVTGIFKTPRGYAAMVEATPIKLSYTIYPGEKFFDGQLVAVEENRLVFRKVTKVSEGKFVASVENKPLQKFSMKAQVEGTAPAGAASDKPAETTTASAPAAAPGVAEAPKTSAANKPGGNPFLSPLDEMNSLPATPAGDAKSKKPAKKPAKVAKNDSK